MAPAVATAGQPDRLVWLSHWHQQQTEGGVCAVFFVEAHDAIFRGKRCSAGAVNEKAQSVGRQNQIPAYVDVKASSKNNNLDIK